MVKKGSGINVKVMTMTNELEFTIKEFSLGKELFDNVLQTTGIREKWYFGLEFDDINDNKCWLEMDKKVADQRIKNLKKDTLQFRFRVRFYPETAEDEIIQTSTLHLFYLQIKRDVLNEDIYCPAEKAVLLASFAAQVKHGNYDGVEQQETYLANDKILPESVVTGHKLSREEWENKISIFHAKHKNMTKEDAMMEYMKVCQDLETYGIAYFDIINSKKTPVWVGVDALGINIYEKNNKLNPNISFPWSEINKISTSGKGKLILIPSDKKSPKLVMTSTQPKIKHQIYHLVNGNHEMYKRRRRPDPLEVQQMKSQRRDEDERKAKERELLNRETAAREKAEQMRIEIEEEVRLKQEEIDKIRNEVEDKERMAKELQEEVEMSRRKMEESMAMMNNNGAADSDTVSETEEADNNSEDIPTIVVDPVDDGREVNMDDEMAGNMEELSKELETMKDEEQESEEHRLYRENVRLTGRDKYKTLRQVRQGNTKRRIDSFENL